MPYKTLIVSVLGTVLLAVGWVYGVADEPTSGATQSYTPRPAQSSALLQIPDDMSIIESDDRTKACMADMACMREIFLKWTFGNDHEGRPPEQQDLGILKAEGPMIVKVVGAEYATAEVRKEVKRGLMDAIAILRSAGMPITTTHLKRRRDPEPIGPANIVVFISDDFYRDQHGRFAQVLKDEFYDGHEDYEGMLKRQHREGAVCTLRSFFGDEMTVTSAAIMVPTTLHRSDLRLCFYQEIIQALGPSYDFRDNLLSIFTDRVVPWFSDFDYLLTRLFFHTSIHPGMSREEVIEIFPKLYESVTTSAPHCLSFDDCLKEFL